MNAAEARELLAQHLASYRTLPYDELARRVGSVETAELTGTSGSKYQIEIEVVWEAGERRDLRVLGAIDDGGWRAFVPLIDDFIMQGPP
jgi:hypothetical protein